MESRSCCFGSHVRFSVQFDRHGMNFLALPDELMPSLECSRPTWVSLTTWSQKRWDVQLSEESGTLFLGKGWGTFKNYYQVVAGDIISFAYDRRSTFVVKIYGAGGMEKHSTRPAEYIGLPNLLVSSEEQPSTDSSPPTSPTAMQLLDEVVAARCSTNKRKSLELANNHGESSERPSAEEVVITENLAITKRPAATFFVDIKNNHLEPGTILLIPTQFAQTHLRMGANTINFVVKGAPPMQVSCNRFRDYSSMTTGWINFAHSYNLIGGDGCLFEPVDTGDNEWRVTIYKPT